MQRLSDSKKLSLHLFFSEASRSSCDCGGGGGESSGGGETSASRFEDVITNTGASAATESAKMVWTGDP